jgi:DNA polymerase-4
VFAVFQDVTPLVEGISVDEAWLDATDSQSLFGDVETIGAGLKEEIRSRTGLTASIGMAPNKFLAKLASDFDKPDGFCRITTEGAPDFLSPLPVERLWGIGPKAAERLHQADIRTIGDLRAATETTLKALLGRAAAHFHAFARGIDDRPVTPDRPVKSVSHEQTFEHDLYRLDNMQYEVMALTEKVCTRLRRNQLRGLTVTVKIRTGNWQTHTRSRTLEQPTASTTELYRTAVELLSGWHTKHRGQGVRLLGLGISALEQSGQGGLFDNGDADVDLTLDDIRQRFGGDAVIRGRLLNYREPE